MAEVNLAEIKFGGAAGHRQTAKLNSPSNFPAIRYNPLELTHNLYYLNPN